MERLSMMGGQSRAIVGEPAPRFTCKAIIDGRIKEISSRTLMNNAQWVILIFFPSAWSFICPTEINAFSTRLAEFTARQASVLFCSTDSEHALRAWTAIDVEEGGLGSVSVPLLSDRNLRVAKEYGVLCEEEGVCQRAVFIVDPTGIIRSLSVNDANVGRSVDEVARVLDALKFCDEYGQGCPVDWKAGQKGINMSPSTHDDLSTTANITSSMSNLTPGPAWTTPKATPPASPPIVSNHAHTVSAGGGRPGMGSRGMSWGGAAAWATAKGARPVSAMVAKSPGMGGVGGMGAMPETPSGRTRPMSIFWGRDANEEAVVVNGQV